MTTATVAQISNAETPTERQQAGEAGWPTPGDRRAERPSLPGRYLEVDGVNGGFIVLDREVTHIGRGLLADVRLDDHLVSRRHAILVRRSGTHQLLDDRSANGTLVNGRPVDRVRLSDGDVIVIGRSVLRYVVVSWAGPSSEAWGDPASPATRPTSSAAAPTSEAISAPRGES